MKEPFRSHESVDMPDWTVGRCKHTDKKRNRSQSGPRVLVTQCPYVGDLANGWCVSHYDYFIANSSYLKRREGESKNKS